MSNSIGVFSLFCELLTVALDQTLQVSSPVESESVKSQNVLLFLSLRCEKREITAFRVKELFSCNCLIDLMFIF